MDPKVWSDSDYSERFEIFPTWVFLTSIIQKYKNFCPYSLVFITELLIMYQQISISILRWENSNSQRAAQNCQVRLYCRNHLNASTNFLRNVGRWKFKWNFIITFVPLCIPNLYLWSEMNAAKKNERKKNKYASHSIKME